LILSRFDRALDVAVEHDQVRHGDQHEQARADTDASQRGQFGKGGVAARHQYFTFASSAKLTTSMRVAGSVVRLAGSRFTSEKWRERFMRRASSLTSSPSRARPSSRTLR